MQVGLSRVWSRRLVTAMCVVAVLAIFVDATSACPTCRQGLTDGDEASQRLITGYFWSIVFMMSMPFAILAGISGLLYREVRKARAKAALTKGAETSIIAESGVEQHELAETESSAAASESVSA